MDEAVIGYNHRGGASASGALLRENHMNFKALSVCTVIAVFGCQTAEDDPRIGAPSGAAGVPMSASGSGGGAQSGGAAASGSNAGGQSAALGGAMSTGGATSGGALNGGGAMNRAGASGADVGAGQTSGGIDGIGGRTGRGGGSNAGAGNGGFGSAGRRGSGGASSGGTTSAGATGMGGASSAGAGGACVENLGCTLTAPASTGDVHQDCVDRINQFRTECACLPPLERWTEGEACADQMAEYDSSQPTAHAAFIADLCEAGSAQNECPGWRSDSQVVSGCLQQMWDEGPPPTTSCSGDCFEEHGHYINMTNTKLTKVACGFYTTSDNKVWSVQNFSR